MEKRGILHILQSLMLYLRSVEGEGGGYIYCEIHGPQKLFRKSSQ